MKLNNFEIRANVIKEPSKKEQVTFLTLGVWTKEKEKDVIVDVAFFGKNKEAVDKFELTVGTPLDIIGSLSNKKDDNGFTVMTLVGRNATIVKVTKKENKVTEETKEEKVTNE